MGVSNPFRLNQPAVDNAVASGVVFPDAVARARILTSPPGQLDRFRRARAGVRSGTGRATILTLGDSLTTGTGAGTGTIKATGARVLRPAYFLAKALSASGIPAVEESLLGDGGLTDAGAIYTNYDPRITYPSWTWSNAAFSAFLQTATDGAVLTFTPATPVDTFVILFARAATSATANVAIGGAAPASGPASVATAGTAGFMKTVVSASNATQAALTITRSGTGTLYVAGIYAYNSAVAGIDVLSASRYGVRSSSVNNASTYGWLNAVKAVAPTLTIINLGTNNITDAGPILTLTTDLESIVAAARVSGDAMLAVPAPISTINDVTYQPYRAALIALGESLKCPVVDLYQRFDRANNATLFADWYDDYVHMKTVGYADVAQAYQSALS